MAKHHGEKRKIRPVIECQDFKKCGYDLQGWVDEKSAEAPPPFGPLYVGAEPKMLLAGNDIRR